MPLRTSLIARSVLIIFNIEQLETWHHANHRPRGYLLPLNQCWIGGAEYLRRRVIENIVYDILKI